MKFLLLSILALTMVGCATISEYDQGCREGIKSLNPDIKQDLLEFHCDYLDAVRSGEQPPVGKANR